MATRGLEIKRELVPRTRPVQVNKYKDQLFRSIDEKQSLSLSSRPGLAF